MRLFLAQKSANCRLGEKSRAQGVKLAPFIHSQIFCGYFSELSSCDRDHVDHSLAFIQFGPSQKHLANFFSSIVRFSDPTIVLNGIRKYC